MQGPCHDWGSGVGGGGRSCTPHETLELGSEERILQQDFAADHMPPSHRARSPLRERKRATSPKRKEEIDYGQDAEKHVRHIARTKKLTTFAGDEGVSHGWPWVLKNLAYRRSHHELGCPVDVLDTVVYGADDAPGAVYYTRNGAIVGDSIGEDQSSVSLTTAIKHLQLPRRYLGVRAPSEASNGAVAFSSAGEATAITSTDLGKIRAGHATPPAGTEALVLWVPTKGACTEPLLSAQHVYALEDGSAKPIHLSYRLSVVKGESKRIPCKSSTVNRTLMRTCNDVVEWIEACSGGRVLSLVLEFVEDALGSWWVVRTSSCATTKTVRPYTQQRRSPSPSQSKVARLEVAKSIADELSFLRYGHGIGQSPAVPSDPSGGERRTPSHCASAAKSPDSCQRARPTTKPPTGASSRESCAARGKEQKCENDSLDTEPRTTWPTTAASVARARQGGEEGREEDAFQGFAAPGEQDPRLVGRSAAAGKALGSSQLRGMCPGDFCGVTLLDKVSLSEDGRPCVPSYEHRPTRRDAKGFARAQEKA